MANFVEMDPVTEAEIKAGPVCIMGAAVGRR